MNECYQREQELHENKKIGNHTANHKKDDITQGDLQQAYYSQPA